MNAEQRASAFLNDFNMVSRHHGVSIEYDGGQMGFVLVEYNETSAHSMATASVHLKDTIFDAHSSLAEYMAQLKENAPKAVLKELEASHNANRRLAQENKNLKESLDAVGERLAGPDL